MKVAIIILLIVILIANIGAKEIIEIYNLPIHNISSRTAGRLNIGYLGIGYHLLKGNPWNFVNGLDPGWRLPLLSYSYSQNLITTDGRWSYPDGTALLSVTDCTYQATAQQTFGVNSYYNKLSTFVSVSGTFPSGSFSGSAGYINTKSSTSTSKTVYVSTVSNCNAYKASLYPLETHPHTPVTQFLNALNALPSTYSSSTIEQFKSFFDTWGTHITTQLTMGARAQTENTFSSTKYDEMITSNVDVTAAAKMSWGFYSGAVSTGVSADIEEKNYFESSRSDVYRVYLGAPPPLNGDFSVWYNNVILNPYPLAYSLRPIHEFIQTTIYASKAAAVSTAFNALCSSTPGCIPITSENPDPVHLPTTYTCRLCASCGGNYKVERGRKLNQGDWGSWDTYGANCGLSSYTETWNEASLCCAGSTTDSDSGMCRLCTSCGGKWPSDGGWRENDGDWGPYKQYGSECAGGYNNDGAPPHLCCNVNTQCRICADYCGNDFPQEVGRANHNGDWSAWNIHSAYCGSSKAKSWSEPVFCCSK